MLRYVTNSRKNNEFTEYPGSLIKFFDLWTWLGARLEQFDPKQIAILILENSGVRVYRSMFSEFFFTSHELFKFTHVFALIEWKSLWFLDSKDHVKILYEGTVFKLTYTILVFSLLVKRSLNLIMQIFLLEFKIVKSEVAEIKVVSLTLYWALTLQAETILILILS